MGPPPVAAKPKSPPKRAALKRTFSVGAGPKKSAVISNAKQGGPGVAGGSMRMGANSAALTAAYSSQTLRSSTELTSSTNTSPNSKEPASYSASTSEPEYNDVLGPQPSSLAESPYRAQRTIHRVSSGSFASTGMSTYSNRLHQLGGSSDSIGSGSGGDGPKRHAPGRLSSAAYAQFTGATTAPAAPHALSPRSQQAEPSSEPPSDSEKIESIDNSRPRRPAAPPRPATLRPSVMRASISTPTPSDFVSATTSEEPTPARPANSVSPSPVKTGAQLRPPVPKKNISQTPQGTDASSTAAAQPQASNQALASDANPAGRSPSPSFIPLRSGGMSRNVSTSLSASDESSPEDLSSRQASSPQLRTVHARTNLIHHKSNSTTPTTSLAPYVFIFPSLFHTLLLLICLPNRTLSSSQNSDLFAAPKRGSEGRDTRPRPVPAHFPRSLCRSSGACPLFYRLFAFYAATATNSLLNWRSEALAQASKSDKNTSAVFNPPFVGSSTKKNLGGAFHDLSSGRPPKFLGPWLWALARDFVPLCLCLRFYTRIHRLHLSPLARESLGVSNRV